MEYKIEKNSIIEDINSDHYEKGMVGLYIKTDKGDIKLMISDGQSCCENYGHMFLETPDDINKFIGAKIKKIEDVCIGESVYEDNEYYSENAGETQLKITTNKGVLQYAVYNEHNGYYGHATFLEVFDVVEEDYL